MKLEKGFRQFLLKTGLFVVLFIAFSLLIGTKLYANNLLTGWEIGIYGRVGYIILFSIAGFILLYRERLLKLENFKYKLRDVIFLLTSFILLGLFYLFEVYANRFQIDLINILIVHLIGISIFIFLGLGIYGLDFVKSFVKRFKRELLYFLGFGIVTGALMNLVWDSWPYLSLAVTEMVYRLLGLFHNTSLLLIPPRTLIFGGFAAEIAEACSGVYSIFLFTALYLFIIFLDWKKLNKKKAWLLFIPAVIGAFLTNVFRVWLLFVVGAFISPEIALGLYHSYAGMIFFLIYFAIFWVLLYNWMKKPEFRSKEEGFIKRWFRHIANDSLYRNSLYLMLSTFVMAAWGFVFWIIGARLFTTEQIGLATAIISAMGLITSFSGLGLATGLIRYLPRSERKNDKINTVFSLVTIVTVIVSTVFLIGLSFFSPKLLFIKENMILAFIFIFFMVVSSSSSLIESIFIAYRHSKYVLIKNTIFSILKIALLFLFVGLGAYGIFSSWMIAMLLGVVTVLIFLIHKFQYKPKFVLYDSVIKTIGRYSFANYIAGFIGGLPIMVLPLIILNELGAVQSAYYFIAMQIAAVLFVIPNAASNSLFAEGSNDEKSVDSQIKRVYKITSLLLIPGILLCLFFGKYILLVFGKDYSSGGYLLLIIFAISAVFYALNGIYGTLLKIKKKIKGIIVVNLIGTVTTLALIYPLIDMGLLGVGIAWIAGEFTQAVASVAWYEVVRKEKKVK